MRPSSIAEVNAYKNLVRCKVRMHGFGAADNRYGSLTGLIHPGVYGCSVSCDRVGRLNELHIVGVAPKRQVHTRVVKRPSPELSVCNGKTGIGDRRRASGGDQEKEGDRTQKASPKRSFCGEGVRTRKAFHLRFLIGLGYQFGF
jgi:hypothetical protein